MKTPYKVLIILLLIALVAAPVLLLVGAAGEIQELIKDLVVSNVDGHPSLDNVVKKIPGDCLECHSKEYSQTP